MAAIKQTLQDQMARWENIRSKGRKSYLIKSWVTPYGFILLVICAGIIPFTSVLEIEIMYIGYFLFIFGPIIFLMVILFGVYSWNYWEREWTSWKTGDGECINKLAGARETFDKYWCFLVAFYCFPFLFFLIISFFIVTIFWFSILFLIIWFILVASSSIFFITTMIIIKNPICGHGLIANPEELELYPNRKQNHLKSAWQILNGKSFICKVCGEQYILEKKADHVEIVKLEREKH